MPPRMTGKSPHRPEGKAGTTQWHRRERAIARSAKHLHRVAPEEKRAPDLRAHVGERQPHGGFRF